MLILGLQGSPRRKGNTDYLLSTFMTAAAKTGATCQTLDVARMDIGFCKELVVCEKKGYCPIKDDMPRVYTLLRRADIIVAASPVFFYSVTAQLKALIDRCQTLWSRKYKLRLKDPGHQVRKGLLLAVGATGGQNLFEGLALTTRYFFDGISAQDAGALTYHHVEGRGDMARHPSLESDIRHLVETLVRPLAQRPRVLFAGRKNDAVSQMAAAFVRLHAGRNWDAASAGSQPADRLDENMIRVMAEKGIDMANIVPRDAAQVIVETPPDIIISTAPGNVLPRVPNARTEDWSSTAPVEGTIDAMRSCRDRVEEKVRRWLGTQKTDA